MFWFIQEIVCPEIQQKKRKNRKFISIIPYLSCSGTMFQSHSSVNFSWVASLEIYPGGFLYSECLANHLSTKRNSIFINVKLHGVTEFVDYVAIYTYILQTHVKSNIDYPQNLIQAIWCKFGIMYEILMKFVLKNFNISNVSQTM